jgi:hypothetical protein
MPLVIYRLKKPWRGKEHARKRPAQIQERYGIRGLAAGKVWKWAGDIAEVAKGRFLPVVNGTKL